MVDRVVLKEDSRTRLSDSLETAVNLSDGVINVKVGDEILVFSAKFACPVCGFSIASIEPRLFSFNAPIGACHQCNGLGITQAVDLELLIPDPSLSIDEGAIRYYKNIVNTQNIEWQTFEKLMEYAKVKGNTPFNKLSKKQTDVLLYGTRVPVRYIIESRSGNAFHRNEPIEGIVDLIERRHRDTTSNSSREWYATFMSETTCSRCDGARLNQSALAVKVKGVNISDFTKQSITEALDFMNTLN